MFTSQPLPPPSFFQRLFGRLPRRQVPVAIENLLAEKGVDQASLTDIQEILNRYRADLHPRFTAELIHLYEKALTAIAGDHDISAEEGATLRHLQALLALDEAMLKPVMEKVGGPLFRKRFAEALDSQMDANQAHQSLRELSERAGLTEEQVMAISTDERGNRVKAAFREMTGDNRLSPEEEAEYDRLCKRLQIIPQFDDATSERLKQMRRYYQMEEGELVPVDVTILLQRGEKCYYTCNVEWYELRRVTHRINYGGPAFRVRLARGLYYRAGSSSVQAISSDEITHIDSGQVYVTNKRLIFDGQRRNITIPIPKILSITAYSDGVGIEKDRGRSPLLKAEADHEALGLMIARMLDEYRKTIQ